MQEDGRCRLYASPEVEIQINELSAVTEEERIRRISILDNKDPDYVRSECVLHFLRKFKGNSPRNYERIWKILFLRVNRHCLAVGGARLDRSWRWKNGRRPQRLAGSRRYWRKTTTATTNASTFSR